MHSVEFQPSLFGAPTASFEGQFRGLERIYLDADAWIDHAPGWVSGSDVLFQQVLEQRAWRQRTRRMYTKKILEPRLTSSWNLQSDESLEPVLIESMRRSLSDGYGVVFDSVGFNWYRNGQDSVAWHSDHIRKEIKEPTIALVSLGQPRKFLLRPKGGGPSRAFALGLGDLLVTGGKAQERWEHSVPKVARAGPRISLAFRYGLDPRAYGSKRDLPPQEEGLG